MHARSSGFVEQVVDELDFVPMDDFQKQFFLLRQGEWLDYKENFPRYSSTREPRRESALV